MEGVAHVLLWCPDSIVPKTIYGNYIEQVLAFMNIYLYSVFIAVFLYKSTIRK